LDFLLFYESLSIAFSLDMVGKLLSALAQTIDSGIYHIKIAPSSPTLTIVL